MPSHRLPTIHRFPELASTQDAARELLSSGRAKLGHIVIADVQTAGRGRYGRSWMSPTGGLYATLVIERRPLVSIATSVAVARALDAFDVPTSLKWPNDVEHDGHKLAGILIETAGEHLLVGIGINLQGAPLPTATSVRQAGVEIRRGDLLLAIWQHLQGDGAQDDVLAEYRARSSTIGSPVRITADDGRAIEGDAVDIDEEGRLLVRTDRGVVPVASGTCEMPDESEETATAD